MTKYCEILRLSALGLSLRNIEKNLNVSRKTIIKVQRRAGELSLQWPLGDSYTDAELERVMFPKNPSPTSTKRMPDYDYIRKELLRNGVNKKLLWTEYLEDCKAAGDDPLMYIVKQKSPPSKKVVDIHNWESGEIVTVLFHRISFLSKPYQLVCQ